jgi:hypothetical protein
MRHLEMLFMSESQVPVIFFHGNGGALEAPSPGDRTPWNILLSLADHRDFSALL